MNIIKYFSIIDTLASIINRNTDMRGIVPRSSPSYFSKCSQSNILIDTTDLLDIELSNDSMYLQNLSNNEVCLYAYYKYKQVTEEGSRISLKKIVLEETTNNIILIPDDLIISDDFIMSLRYMLDSNIVIEHNSLNYCIKTLSINLLISLFVSKVYGNIDWKGVSPLYKLPYYSQCKGSIDNIISNIKESSLNDGDHNEIEDLYVKGDIISYISKDLYIVICNDIELYA